MLSEPYLSYFCFDDDIDFGLLEKFAGFIIVVN